MEGRKEGRMEGRKDGRESGVKDCLQQSKIKHYDMLSSSQMVGL